MVPYFYWLSLGEWRPILFKVAIIPCVEMRTRRTHNIIAENTCTIVNSLQHHPNASLNSGCYYIKICTMTIVTISLICRNKVLELITTTSNNAAKRAAVMQRSRLPKIIKTCEMCYLWLTKTALIKEVSLIPSIVMAVSTTFNLFVCFQWVWTTRY